MAEIPGIRASMIALILALGAWPTQTAAAEPAPPAQAKELPPALARVVQKTHAIKSLQVDMRQIKILSVFDETMISNGTLLFSRPRRLRMDLDGAGGTTLVISGDTMSMLYKALKKRETMSLSRDPRAKAIAEHLFLLLDADPVALSEVYTVTLLAEKPVRIRLQPRAEALARLIAKVEAVFDSRGFVAELKLFESNADTTTWQFSNPVINKVIADERFTLSAP